MNVSQRDTLDWKIKLTVTNGTSLKIGFIHWIDSVTKKYNSKIYKSISLAVINKKCISRENERQIYS